MEPELRSLAEQIQTLCMPIPPEVRAELAPAVGCIYEWQTDYWLECPGADSLRAGTDCCLSPRPGLFNLRFENQLGLTALQPFAGERPLAPPCYVEVISPKFPSPAAHLCFYRALLDDLFARAAQLPFTFGGRTTCSVLEALRPPTPLFALHFLCSFAADLVRAIAVVRAAPHRRLRDTPDLVPLAEVTDVDADVLLSIVRSPDRWRSARGFTLAKDLRGHAPTQVWQRCPEETSDTPENRFVRAFLRQLLAAAESLPAQRWWTRVPSARQAIVRETAALLRHALAQPPLADAGPLHHLPLSSQVLLRRDGYCELLDLWQRFQQSRRPLFAPLQQALEVRDVATLYEIWIFFRLVDDIAILLRQRPVVDVVLSDDRALEWRSEARFDDGCALVYNQAYRQPRSYSVPLRPDFTWMCSGCPEVVLDAKFRLEWLALVGDDAEEADTKVKQEDLYKMHTYRDALGVRAAVAVYPGDQAVFYEVQRGRSELPPTAFPLDELLNGDLSGVGALPLKPG